MTGPRHRNARNVPPRSAGPGPGVRRICVIGSGISGLSSAHYLADHQDVDITVYEQDSVFGGRANVSAGGEHCPRVFLGDYTHLFDIMKAIRTSDGRSVYDTLRPVGRYYRTADKTWQEISHLYLMLAGDVPLSEKFRIAKAARRSVLIAEQGAGANTNRYGSVRNYSVLSLLHMMPRLLRSRRPFLLGGATDQCFIDPWVRHLTEQGVTFKHDAPVTAVRSGPDGVEVVSQGRSERFDAVVVTAFVPDAADLLSASGLEHALEHLEHIHCKCFTLTLDAREPILDTGRPGIYCDGGINFILLPAARRCVVLCLRSPSTETGFVLRRVREFLDLEHEFAAVHVRDNQRPAEAVYHADYVSRDRILRRDHPHLHFAGSYIRNSYPVDSGEGAARSALDVVRAMRGQYALTARTAAVR